MNKENVSKWIAALRSGKYKQGKGALKYYTDGNTCLHCAVGVACEIMNPGGFYLNKSKQFDDIVIDVKAFQLKDVVNPVVPDTKTNALLFSDDINKWLGLDTSFILDITKYNDGGSSFDRIADYIEDVLLRGEINEQRKPL